jgi:hypothetical protein
MYGNPVHDEHGLEAWRQRVAQLERRAVRVQTVRDQLLKEPEEKAREVERLGESILRLVKTGELLRALLDHLVLDQVKSIEAIVSEGLRSIFYDQLLAFEAEVSTRYNKLAIDFFIRQGADDNQVRGTPLESFGGGPSSLASLVLRLLTLMRLKKYPLLLLDETLLAISDEYVELMSKFLQTLSKTTGIDVLLVTHKAAFADHSTVAYQGSNEVQDDGVWNLKVRKIRGSA